MRLDCVRCVIAALGVAHSVRAQEIGELHASPPGGSCGTGMDRLGDALRERCRIQGNRRGSAAVRDARWGRRRFVVEWLGGALDDDHRHRCEVRQGLMSSAAITWAWSIALTERCLAWSKLAGRDGWRCRRFGSESLVGCLMQMIGITRVPALLSWPMMAASRFALAVLGLILAERAEVMSRRRVGFRRMTWHQSLSLHLASPVSASVLTLLLPVGAGGLDSFGRLGWSVAAISPAKR